MLEGRGAGVLQTKCSKRAAKSEAGKVSEVVPDRALCAKPSALSTEAGSWYPEKRVRRRLELGERTGWALGQTVCSWGAGGRHAEVLHRCAVARLCKDGACGWAAKKIKEY